MSGVWLNCFCQAEPCVLYTLKPIASHAMGLVLYTTCFCFVYQESLESEVPLDPMAGEQTWPSEQELREAEGEEGGGEK